MNAQRIRSGVIAGVEMALPSHSLLLLWELLAVLVDGGGVQGARVHPLGVDVFNAYNAS